MEVAAIVTGDSARAAEARSEFPDAAILPVADEIWARPGDYDLVVVAAPNSVHAPLTQAALDCRIPVVVDKPFVPTGGEAEALAAQARELEVPLAVFHNRRWDDDFLAISSAIAGGAVGQVLRVESRFDRWRPEVDADRWRERAGGADAGGLLFDLGSHLIDQALVLFGEPDWVYAELDARRVGAEVDDDSFVALGFGDGGPRVHLSMSTLAADRAPRFRVAGTEGALEIHGLDPQENALRSGLRPGMEGWIEALAGRRMRIARADGDEVAHEDVPIGPGAYQAFYAGVQAMVADGAPPPVPAEDALAVLRVIEAARA